ncbi:lysophosphatidylserine lipase ABHD12 isoform X2 [Teleopsis dalmanni]|uniref:lysophosphatidylserine lipase ABHD12 isoform X2 n=1 Tax=Teleopsis dalmanni TaxID=139649 RepID=UPI0018CDA1AA|nr:lysophosphatidylserine lipase ABHD12 isoform X2 [Teleopsis dalmanni]
MYEIHNFINVLFCATVIPGSLLLIWMIGLISLILAQIGCVILLTVFVIFPVIFRYSITLQRGILFLTFIRYPKDLDLTNPASIGLYGTRNFYLTVKDSDVDDEEGVRIGVWHVLPVYMDYLQEDLFNTTETKDETIDQLEPTLKSEFPEVTAENEQLFYERLLKIPGTIILYLHGNTATRGSGHRAEVYRVIRKLGYHVLSLDYRGYADSDPVPPTEEGVVRDAMAVYQYIRNITSNPIIIWGHSLGTGVSTNLCAQLNYMNEQGPRGVILESPFTNIREEIRLHPFARLFKHLPWFDLTISRPMYSNSLRFESDHHISQFRQPILIIHAEDDYVVPFHLGYKLYRIALDTRGKSWGPVEFHRFDGSMAYGHKYLCRAPNLPGLISNFVNTYRNEVY